MAARCCCEKLGKQGELVASTRYSKGANSLFPLSEYLLRVIYTIVAVTRTAANPNTSGLPEVDATLQNDTLDARMATAAISAKIRK